MNMTQFLFVKGDITVKMGGVCRLSTFDKSIGTVRLVRVYAHDYVHICLQLHTPKAKQACIFT